MIKLKCFEKSLYVEKNLILDLIDSSVKEETPMHMSIIDAVVLNRALKDEKYNKLLNSFDELLCDSSLIVFLYNWIYNKKIKGFNGPDLFEVLVHEKKYNQLIIGTTQEMFNEVKNKSSNKNLFYLDIGFKNNWKDFNYELIESYVLSNNINILWVMLGNPKQDYVSMKLKDRGLINSVVISSGAAYLFYLDSIKNSTIEIKGLKFLWLRRILQNPRRQLIRSLEVLKNIKKFINLFK